jgi:molybdopterin-guanine dinucleotide biosynthesis protein MobB
MKIFGLAGWSGSGKTTLTARLLPALIARGLTVSTMKHAHHNFDIDQPGKDSYVHRMAGASEVLVASANRWALMHEHRGAPEPSAAELMRQMTPVDLLLIEGFKRELYPKLEVYRAVNGKPLLHPDDPHIVAVASDVPLAQSPLPVISIDDIPAIADFIIRHCGLQPKTSSQPSVLSAKLTADG